MKPKKLKFPFRWESRTPLLLDNVLYVPKFYEHHDEWSREELGARLSAFQSISVEYCSGNGAWIAEKALENSSTLWIAVEKRFDRVQKIWAKTHNLSISNLLIVCGDALVFTKHYLQSELVDQIFINFPDPWPKAKHAKNRVIREPFVKEMHRISKPGAEAVLVTDDATYSEQVSSEMLRDGVWDPSFPSPFYMTEWPGYGSSFFDSLWRERGREIRYMKFKK